MGSSLVVTPELTYARSLFVFWPRRISVFGEPSDDEVHWTNIFQQRHFERPSFHIGSLHLTLECCNFHAKIFHKVM